MNFDAHINSIKHREDQRAARIEAEYSAWVDAHRGLTGWDVLSQYPGLSVKAGDMSQFADLGDSYEAMRDYFSGLNGAAALNEIDAFDMWLNNVEG